jgi:plasmid stabilization system protein ParE
MKTSYHRVWTERAEKDLLAIVSYIARDSPSNALNILRKLKNPTSRLNHAPTRSRMIPELQEQGLIMKFVRDPIWSSIRSFRILNYPL